jgi:hypothetical protein
MKEIKLKVMPDGEVKIEVRGVKGDECLKLTEFLENQLGLVVKREKTPEYYQAQDKVVTKVNNKEK